MCWRNRFIKCNGSIVWRDDTSSQIEIERIEKLLDAAWLLQLAGFAVAIYTRVDFTSAWALRKGPYWNLNRKERLKER